MRALAIPLHIARYCVLALPKISQIDDMPCQSNIQPCLSSLPDPDTPNEYPDPPVSRSSSPAARWADNAEPSIDHSEPTSINGMRPPARRYRHANGHGFSTTRSMKALSVTLTPRSFSHKGSEGGPVSRLATFTSRAKVASTTSPGRFAPTNGLRSLC